MGLSWAMKGNDRYYIEVSYSKLNIACKDHLAHIPRVVTMKILMALGNHPKVISWEIEIQFYNQWDLKLSVK